MKRPWQMWIAFGLCLAVVLAAMGWVSRTALRLGRAETEARRQAAIEEDVRLALWRMDSALGPLIARESARPYFVYNAFYPAERAYTRMFAQIRQGEVLVPSPLLTETPAHILIHFQFNPDGSMTSPQAPTGNMRDLAETGYTTHEEINLAAERLAELEPLLRREDLLSLLPRKTPPWRPVPIITRLGAAPRRQVEDAQAQQQVLNVIEAQSRARSYERAIVPQPAKSAVAATPSSEIPPCASEGAIHPLWVGSALILARRVSVNGGEYLQGCRLDWPGVKTWLLGEISDLLPKADLAPTGAADAGRRLAALPVRLVPGEVPVPPAPVLSPISVSLIIAWACVLLAAGAAAALLLGAVSLSERRGAFVSAVTHELRTPLTTFRMYTEMLAEKMAPAEKRKEYLDTLRTEADRLGHLVENVLAYARLERNRATSRLDTVSLAEIRDRVQDRLAERARQAGMRLVVEEGETWNNTRVRASLSAVEQIIFNLVDNACKYASRSTDRRIHLEADCAGKRVILRVRDHGPGIPRGDARRLFKPFSKSSQEAADSAPGVGLGLALCRRLARNLGGNLTLDPKAQDGACFILALQAA